MYPQAARRRCSKTSGYIIFDVKMNFTLKVSWVKDGHLTSDLDVSKYADVISRESKWIVLTYEALHGIEVLAVNIRNAYLQAPTSVKHYIICGEEFGLENVGKQSLVADRDFWHHHRSCMGNLGFKSKGGDPNVWMCPMTKSDCSQVYEYVLLYIDDCLVISDNAEHILKKKISRYFELKPSSIGPPSLYIRGNLRLVKTNKGMEAWAFSSTQYVKEAVASVKVYLKNQDAKLKQRV